jgi:hypothetical protein
VFIQEGVVLLFIRNRIDASGLLLERTLSQSVPLSLPLPSSLETRNSKRSREQQKIVVACEIAPLCYRVFAGGCRDHGVWYRFATESHNTSSTLDRGEKGVSPGVFTLFELLPSSQTMFPRELGMNTPGGRYCDKNQVAVD